MLWDIYFLFLFLFYSNMRVSLVVKKNYLTCPSEPGIKAIRNHGSGVPLKGAPDLKSWCQDPQ